MNGERGDFLTTHAERWDDVPPEPPVGERWSKSAAELDALIATVVADAPECRFCIVGPVVRQAPDAFGTNWRISRLEGSGCLDCLERIRPRLEVLQASYTLVTVAADRSATTAGPV